MSSTDGSCQPKLLWEQEKKKKKYLRKAFTSKRGDNALTREMQLGIEVEEGPIEQHSALAESQPATEESNTLDFVGPRGQDNWYTHWTNRRSRVHAVINAHQGHQEVFRSFGYN